MKKILTITYFLLCCFSFAQLANAQEQTESLRDRLARRQQQQQGVQDGANVPSLSVRAEMMNEGQSQDLSNATWIRGIYRFLDLKKGANGALLYPEQPVGNRMNLFTMIFKLMGNGSLVGYDFNNGQDIFAEQMKIDFKNILENLEIPFQQNGNIFIYDEYSIPSNEALGYYIKEEWYFDQSNSVLGVKVTAICPILFRQDYSIMSLEGVDMMAERYPQFWIKYDDLRPYAARMPVMTSDLNNVMNKTVDDFFRMRLYEGEIYKTTNMENKVLIEKYKTPEALKEAQEKIEGELKQFEKNLWVSGDSINDVNAKNTKNSKNNKTKTKTPKASKPKGSSSGGSATYSARDRR